MQLDPKKIEELQKLSFTTLFYKGDLELLKRPKITIVGTRRPSSYTKRVTFELASMLSRRGFVIVSGAAMGVDALAHRGAGAKNTIAVMPGGVDVIYPAINASLIEEIANKGLLLSPYKNGEKPTKWSFVERNEIVVALGKVVIITEATLKSGSMRSAEYALKMQKQIYVLPHRIGESEGTNELLKKGLAKPIYDVEEFCNLFFPKEQRDDPFIAYLKTAPLYADAMKRYAERIFEAELLGEIEIRDGRVYYKGSK